MIIGLGNFAATATTNLPATGGPVQWIPPRSRPEMSDSANGLEEGRDYRFQAMVNGKPIHWPCSKSIPVTIEGNAPSGAGAALEVVVERLRNASGLPLTVVRASELRIGAEGVIRIRYVEEDEEAFGMRMVGDVVGKARPSYDSNGVIVAGHLIIRNDVNPKTGAGRQVLMHEIGHTLGLDHSADGVPEVMDPTSDPDDEPILGPGDRHALRAVGC